MRVLAIGVVGLLFGGAQSLLPQTISLRNGLVIDHSVRVKPGRYRLTSTAIDRPALVLRGSDVTVDLTDVTIEGGERYADPDRFTGTALLVDGATNATIRGGAIRGFKVAIVARHANRLHITGADLSHNWKPRLLSGIEQENQSDWLSYHNNEHDEWLRYGAAIYVTDSIDAEIDHVRAVQGMNGLMMVRSSRAVVWNNTFSWLSGIGVGMYRTTDSRIMHNKIDYCVRGYSHGFYNRGQDSAGLLMYEQSSRNVVAYNSITHGGDGVFLWAGQSTMDTGQGGANDNLFYDNDVSSAVANGIEATFSRNTIANNRIDDCWHGIWGGYSFDTVISGNTFTDNVEGIAIEHGQNNTIYGNSFHGGQTSIRLWANATEDPNWGYPKARDTRSRNYLIADNHFVGEKLTLDIKQTEDVRSERVDLTNAAIRFQRPDPLPGGTDAKLPPTARRGRATIIVDEWGPYDYLSPKLWPAGRPTDRPLKLRVLGPEGQWRLRSITGASASSVSGSVPGEIAVTPSGRGADLRVTLEYIGGVVTSPRGEITPAGRPHRFSYALFDPAIDWSLKFWRLTAATDPLAQASAFKSLLETTPARAEETDRISFPNARAFGEGWADHLAIAATGSVDLPAGKYELSVTSDDGIRVWVDDRLAIENWSIHGPAEDHVALSGGQHRLRLEYFQNTGAAALIVQIKRH